MHVLVHFIITLVDGHVIMHWRLRTRQRKVACALCKGDAQSVFLAMLAGGIVVLSVMVIPNAFAGACHQDG